MSRNPGYRHVTAVCATLNCTPNASAFAHTTVASTVRPSGIAIPMGVADANARYRAQPGARGADVDRASSLAVHDHVDRNDIARMEGRDRAPQSGGALSPIARHSLSKTGLERP